MYETCVCMCVGMHVKLLQHEYLGWYVHAKFVCVSTLIVVHHMYV